MAAMVSEKLRLYPMLSIIAVY